MSSPALPTDEVCSQESSTLVPSSPSYEPFPPPTPGADDFLRQLPPPSASSVTIEHIWGMTWTDEPNAWEFTNEGPIHLWTLVELNNAPPGFLYHESEINCLTSGSLPTPALTYDHGVDWETNPMAKEASRRFMTMVYMSDYEPGADHDRHEVHQMESVFAEEDQNLPQHTFARCFLSRYRVEIQRVVKEIRNLDGRDCSNIQRWKDYFVTLIVDLANVVFYRTSGAELLFEIAIQMLKRHDLGSPLPTSTTNGQRLKDLLYGARAGYV
ncbi:hypothetical protein HDU96_002155, partial [Phlyctochytrium bullatum]